MSAGYVASSPPCERVPLFRAADASRRGAAGGADRIYRPCAARSLRRLWRPCRSSPPPCSGRRRVAAQAQRRRRGSASFQSWTAATHAEGGQKVCYAFTRATRSEGVPNRAANNVLLVVTHRPKGRDQVALQAGYAYPRNAEGGDPVQVSVGGTSVGFYTAGSQRLRPRRQGGASRPSATAGRRWRAGPVPNGRGARRATPSPSPASAPPMTPSRASALRRPCAGLERRPTAAGRR